MPVRLRLQRHGRRKRPFYHIVAADSRSPRDGKFIEKLGTYNPMTKPATIDLDRMAAYDWLMKGAQPSNTVAAILRFKGVMYYKHLMRGVTKGALTQEQASDKWTDFIESKEGNAEAVRQKESQKILAFHKAVAGVAPVIAEPEPEPVVEEVAEVPASAEETLTTPDDQPEEAAATEAAVAEAAGEGVESAPAPDADTEAAKVMGEAVAEAEAATAAEEGLKAAEETAPEGASDVEKNA